MQIQRKKRKSTKVVLTEATTSIHAKQNIETALAWSRGYTENITKFLYKGNKTAGKRAKAHLYNLKGNSGVINRSMSKCTGLWRDDFIAS